MSVSGFSYCLTLWPTVLAFVTHMNAAASNTVAITWNAYRQLDVQVTQAERERKNEKELTCAYISTHSSFLHLSHYKYVHDHLINKITVTLFNSVSAHVRMWMSISSQVR